MWSQRLRACLVVLSVVSVLGLSACGGAGESARTADTTSYTFDARVTEEQRSEIGAAVAATSEWLESQAGMAMPVLHVTAEPEGTAFLAGLGGRYTITDSDAEGIRQTVRSAAALTVGHDILLVVDDRWQSLGPEKRSFVVAHEIFHVVQYVLASGKADAPVGGAVPGPAWLVEGSADLFAARVISDAGGRSFDDYLREYEARARSLRRGTLGELEEVSVHAAWGAQAQYTLGFLATERLTEGSGPLALFSLWRGAGSGQPWETSFRDTFGQPMAAFYREFDAGWGGSGAQAVAADARTGLAGYRPADPY